MYNVWFFFDMVGIRVHFSLEGGREARVREMHYIYLRPFLILILMFYLGGEDIFLIFFFFFFFCTSLGFWIFLCLR